MRRAAQYLRVSARDRDLSIAGQMLAIGSYAQNNGYQVVATYEDRGRSGLTARGRPAFLQLIADIAEAQRGFDAILVLDVSRWGRFQDADEAAHYEFMCLRAGVEVIYCNEGFAYEQNAYGNVVKALKRMMAAEFSRELSQRIYAAQMRQARLGRKQGGRAPFGYRRMLCNADGTPDRLLERGEQKAIAHHRVEFTHGPPSEREIVRRIFHQFVALKLNRTAIAKGLEASRVPSPGGGARWSVATVTAILQNELHTGVYCFNRSSQRLKKARVRNPPSLWVRTPVMPALIDAQSFRTAQQRLATGRAKPLKLSDAEILRRLARLSKEGGPLTTRSVRRCSYTPNPSVYVERFGSFRNAQQMIGQVVGREPCRLSPTELLTQLLQAYREVGFISASMINGRTDLPSPTEISRKFGSLSRAYSLAGIPTKTFPSGRIFAIRSQS